LEVSARFSWRSAAPLFLSRGKVGIVQSGLGTAGWFVVAGFLLHTPISNKPDCMDAVNDGLKTSENFTAGRKAGLD